mmetsp:Transcript_11681/g.25046  ORF Transcript_11681/g.25046 Transcript_11681/m.25046 type:complete len:421 (+) Transcript_11681:151-1413(+)|eukprot:CAMPEP_0202901762 /NCGR_PEP_ID=MMETSP1392-20130828/14544_1 /ASSEMBLY_ACC=CAM_ASM_000868 /TAXON_ID=225041 /ORGANISM="Chlamydomonas chlamydogama, Strain SAG 11-48b" /LENGTH=420 /DNA_ID=CAMNT_0049588373 /DNA_START=127 /DNA_END=1389 /DNA_ORIENTATION=+
MQLTQRKAGLGAALPVKRSAIAAPKRAPRQALKVVAVAAPMSGNTGVDDDGCKVFYDKDGSIIRAMCADYGFRSGSGRLYEEKYGETPTNVWELAKANFAHELQQLRNFTRRNQVEELYEGVPTSNIVLKGLFAAGGALVSGLGSLDKALEEAGALPELKPLERKEAFNSEEWQKIREKLRRLKLDNNAVMAREQQRIKKEGDIDTPLWVKIPFIALCWVLDVVYENRPIPKFWVLETVARIPYFAYISILHLYESVGFWRAGAELRKIHFAEEWNEMHHLQIMESLGGDQVWFDRFLAEHAAILYYWVLIFFYLVSPKLAYNFMQRVEFHAADTYTEFLETNRELLRSIPPPMVALNYYRNQDLYLFDEFQTGRKSPRRPPCNNLEDVFNNIREDEIEHVKTMDACQKETIAKEIAKKL